MTRSNQSTNLIITGVGGQGNVLAASLLASLALAEGYEVTVGDVYGLTQRGGSVASHIRWTKGTPLPPIVPRGSLDILVAFEPLEALRVLSQFGSDETKAIVNTRPIVPIGVQTGQFEYPALAELFHGLRKLTRTLRLVNATGIAQKFGNVQALNMVMLGALFGSGLIGLRVEVFEMRLASLVSKRDFVSNLSAFQSGVSLASDDRFLPTDQDAP